MLSVDDLIQQGDFLVGKVKQIGKRFARFLPRFSSFELLIIKPCRTYAGQRAPRGSPARNTFHQLITASLHQPLELALLLQPAVYRRRAEDLLRDKTVPICKFNMFRPHAVFFDMRMPQAHIRRLPFFDRRALSIKQANDVSDIVPERRQRRLYRDGHACVPRSHAILVFMP